MAFTPPASPVTNQIYSAASGQNWIWNGTQWIPYNPPLGFATITAATAINAGSASATYNGPFVISTVSPYLILPTARGGTGTATSTGTGSNVLSTSPTITTPTITTPTITSATLSGTTSAFAAILTNAAETTNVVAGAINTTPTAYLNTGSVVYYTSAATASWTQNLAFSSGTTMNTALSTGQTVTIAILTTQGATAYYMSGTLTIDGSSTGVTTYWQGGSAPASGNASSIDVYTYSITKTASATYIVLASQTQFK